MFTPTQEILKLDGAMIRYRKLLANNAQAREIKVVEKKQTFHDKFIKQLSDNTPHSGQFDEDI